jgi:DNA polymerase I-like protein with 3'-5' exonuclease and polymerase domains/5'-3' exonuclease
MNRCILDLRGLALHAYYSDKHNVTQTVRNKAGEKVPAAAHGVAKFVEIYLEPILKVWSPIQIIAALEGNKANLRRRRMLPEYKETKEQDADDETIAEQKNLCIEGCQRLLMHLGATLVSTPFAEADDTIAHLARRLPGQHSIYTVDNDLMALWNPNLQIWVTDRSIGQPELKDTFKGMELAEVGSRMVTLYKSMVGDSSDKIKGIPGLGETKFYQLAQDYGWDGMAQLADIVDQADWKTLDDAVQGDPTNKILALISAQRESWRMSWRVASLHPEWCEESFGDKPVAMKWAKRLPIEENVRKELSRFNLDYLTEEFKPYFVKQWLLDAPKLKAMKANGTFEKMVKDMRAAPILAFDWETFDTLKNPAYLQAGKGRYVDVLNSEPTGGSFCFGKNLNLCFYLPTNHRDTANVDNAELTDLLKRTEGVERVAHNSMFESVVAAKQLDYRFPLENLPHDTAVMSSYADENEESGLKKLSKAWLNYDQTNYSEVVPEGKDMRDISGPEVLAYGCDDSVVTAHLYVLFQTIMFCEQTWDFYATNERCFYESHLDSFIKGVPMDYVKLKTLQEEDKVLFETSEAKLRALLKERCSETNEQGFKVLWPEVREYVEATYKHACAKKEKEVDQELLKKKLEDAEETTREGCRYVEFQAPVLEVKAPMVSHAAKAVGLATIRSLRPEKLEDWCDSMEAQAEDQGVELTKDQNIFLSAIRMWAIQKDDSVIMRRLENMLSKDRTLWTGTELNVGSPPQMARLMYGMLGLPILIRNEADEGSARDQFELEGAPATNELAMLTWLVELPEDDWRREAIELIRTLRGCRQRESLYYKPYPLWQSPIDGRVHPQFRNCGTITRRPSGSSPNFLQISKVKDEGRVRSCVLPQSADTPGAEPEVIVSIDWAQQEVRLAAAASQDPKLLACYVGDNRLDVHTTTSVEIMNVYMKRERKPLWNYEQYEVIRKDKSHPDNARSVEVRNKQGKPTVFTLLYKGSPVGLSRKLVVSRELGEEFFNAFFKAYPKVEDRQNWVVDFARKHGYSLTMFGNRKHVPNILSKDSGLRGGAERQVVNMEMQGTAADICKMTCREWLHQNVTGKTGATLYAFVYDEIVASVPVSKVKLYIDMMLDIMQITLPGTEVVLEAEASLGPSWGKQIELNNNHSQENIDKAVQEALK